MATAFSLARSRSGHHLRSSNLRRNPEFKPLSFSKFQASQTLTNRKSRPRRVASKTVRKKKGTLNKTRRKLPRKANVNLTL